MGLSMDQVTALAEKVGVDVNQLPDRLMGTYLMAMAEKVGVNVDELPDRLYTTIFGAIIENFGGSGGGSGSGGLNIAYGDTAPDDTSKLWVKTSEPSGVEIAKLEGDVENNVAELSTKLTDRSWGLFCASVGTDIYVFGGANIQGVYHFDTLTQKLTSLGISLDLTFASCVAVGTLIYIFGGKTTGGTYKTEVYVFDTETKQLTKHNETYAYTGNLGLEGIGCVAVDSIIYLLGGVNNSTYSNWISKFDTSQDKFVVSSEYLSKALAKHFCAAIDKKIYLFGGSTTYGTTQTAGYCFDTEHGTIETLPVALPKALYSGACFAYDNKVYLVGGRITGQTHSDKIYCYDTVSEELKEIENLTWQNSGFASVENALYLFGNGTASDAIYRFAVGLGLDLKDGFVRIVPQLDDNIFKLTNTSSTSVAIGVDKVYKGNADGKGEEVEAALFKDGAWTTI